MSDKKVYPSWRYCKNGEAKIIKSEKEDKALGPDWAMSPADWEDHKEKEPVKKEE